MVPQPETHEELGEKALSRFADFAHSLLDLSSGQTTEEVSDHDHFGFMCLTYLSKQNDHMSSILALSPIRDVMMIARSMIEGVAQLLWAKLDPDVQPGKWMAFSVVHNWKLMRHKLSRGLVVEPRVDLPHLFVPHLELRCRS